MDQIGIRYSHIVNSVDSVCALVNKEKVTKNMFQHRAQSGGVCLLVAKGTFEITKNAKLPPMRCRKTGRGKESHGRVFFVLEKIVRTPKTTLVIILKSRVVHNIQLGHSPYHHKQTGVQNVNQHQKISTKQCVNLHICWSHICTCKTMHYSMKERGTNSFVVLYGQSLVPKSLNPSIHLSL